MKQFIVGLTCGAILMATGSAFAASELVGKEVQSEVSIQLDGTSVSNGVIIEGSTYAPVRSIGEAVGLDVTYDEGVVSLSSETSELIDYSVPELEQHIEVTEEEKRKSRIKFLKKEIPRYEEVLAKQEEMYADQPLERRAEYIEQVKSELDALKAELAKLEAELAAE